MSALVEQLSKKASPALDQTVWGIGAVRPKGDSRTIFLVDAVQAAGAAKFGDAWTNDEIHCSLSLPAFPVMSLNPPVPRPSIATSRASAPAPSTAPRIDFHKLVVPMVEPKAHVIAYQIEIARREWEETRKLNGERLSRLLAVIQWIGDRARDGGRHRRAPGDPAGARTLS